MKKILANSHANGGIALVSSLSQGAAQPPRNMTVASADTRIMLAYSPRKNSELTNAIPPFAWLFAKIFFMVSLLLWFRATFPRYRYDQIMRLGWKVFIPATLVWLVVIAAWMQTPWNIW